MDQTKEAARERKLLWVEVNEILFSYRSGFLCCGSSEQVVGMILYSQNVLAVKSSLREKVISSGKDVYIRLYQMVKELVVPSLVKPLAR